MNKVFVKHFTFSVMHPYYNFFDWIRVRPDHTNNRHHFCASVQKYWQICDAQT